MKYEKGIMLDYWMLCSYLYSYKYGKENEVLVANMNSEYWAVGLVHSSQNCHLFHVASY